MSVPSTDAKRKKKKEKRRRRRRSFDRKKREGLRKEVISLHWMFSV